MLGGKWRMAIMALGLAVLLVASAATAGDGTREIPISGNEQGVRVWAQVTQAGRMSVKPFVAIPSRSNGEMALDRASAVRKTEEPRNEKVCDGKEAEAVAGLVKEALDTASATVSGKIGLVETAKAVKGLKTLVRQAKKKLAPEPPATMLAGADRPGTLAPAGTDPARREPGATRSERVDSALEESAARPVEDGVIRAAGADEIGSFRILLN